MKRNETGQENAQGKMFATENKYNVSVPLIKISFQMVSPDMGNYRGGGTEHAVSSKSRVVRERLSRSHFTQECDHV